MKFPLSLLTLFSAVLCAKEIVLPLGNLGSVRYTYDAEHLLQIDRMSDLDEVMYTHSYSYDENGWLVSESLIGDLGNVEYKGNRVIKSPYSLEICEYDEQNNLVRRTQDGIVHEYSYTDLNELIAVDELTLCEFDDRGNLVQKGGVYFIYDHENHLMEISSDQYLITCEYDSSGKRISRTVNGEVEHYLYFGSNEMAVIDSVGMIKELRIPGLSPHTDVLRPIAIETRDAIYAPIHDIQGNIVKLINISTKEMISLAKADPFGRGLSKTAPTSWIFSGKHYDREVDLVYFGGRYYCPELRKWITGDPEYQSADLYEYCLNNPFGYVDPDGRWAVPLVSLAWGAGATITAPIWAPYAAAAAAGAAVGYLGYQAYQYWQENQSQKPPYNWDDLGDNPARCPGDGFIWKGRGRPESGKGNWVKGEKPNQEKLNPDLDHPQPIGPHWDYEGPDFPSGVRIKPDGTWEYKPAKE